MRECCHKGVPKQRNVCECVSFLRLSAFVTMTTVAIVQRLFPSADSCFLSASALLPGV